MIEPDDLAELLAAPEGQPRAANRAGVLHATERYLVRVRWLRRASRVAAAAAIFAIGGAAGWFTRPERQRVVEVAGDVVAVPVVVPVIVHASTDSPSPPAPPLSAIAAELLAEQADERAAAAALYKQAGDTFLREQDYPNATRCYRIYLARAGDNALSLDPNDSWLLVSLKNADFKEKAHVVPKNDG